MGKKSRNSQEKLRASGKWSKLVSLDLIRQLVKVSASVPTSTASRHRSPRHTDAFCLAFCSLVIDDENHPLERKRAEGAVSDPYPAERNKSKSAGGCHWEPLCPGRHLACLAPIHLRHIGS